MVFAGFLHALWEHIPALESALAQIAQKGIPPLQNKLSGHRQQRVVYARPDISVMLLTAAAVDALHVPLANLQITAAQRNVRSAGKERMLLKVHRTVSLVRQESIPTRMLLRACHAVQDFPLREGANASHVLRAHTALQMATSAHHALQAHTAPALALKQFNAARAHTPWSWVERSVIRVPKACSATPAGPASASRVHQARHLMRWLTHVTLVCHNCCQ